MAPLLMLTRKACRERHPDADAEHLGRLVSRRVEQRDDLDQRQERDGTDEHRHPRLAEQRDPQDDRSENERGDDARTKHSSASEPAVAVGVVGQGRVKVVGGEVRPVLRAEDELGVGGLPEQEVAGSLVTPGADQDVDIGLAGGVEVLGEVILVDPRGVGGARDERACGIDDLGASGVVEADVEREPALLPWCAPRLLGSSAGCPPVPRGGDR